MDRLWQDLRFAVRMLIKNPGWSAIIIVTLALGIGANTAIFSVVNGVLLAPLPYQDPERLVIINENNPDNRSFAVSFPNYQDWRAQSSAFTEMAALRGASFNLTGLDEPEALTGVYVTASFFSVLGTEMRGRGFLPEEDRPGGARVAVISHGLWQRRLGGAAGALNSTLTLNGEQYTIVGILPASVQQNNLDILVPMALVDAQMFTRGNHILSVMARLKPGVSVQQAEQELKAIAARLGTAYPATNGNWSVTVTPMIDAIVGSQFRRSLYVLMGAVALVLLIACANVANLLLVRAAGRQREVAIRAAIGASRWQLARQFFTESLLLAVLGGGIGLLLALWGIDLLVSSSNDTLPRVNAIAIDWRVLAFTLAVAVLTSFACGIAPAFQATRANFLEALKDGVRGSDAVRRRLRSLLVVSEITLALVLLAGAGLLIKSFLRLQQVDLGFNSENLLTMQLSLPAARYGKGENQMAFYNQLIERVATVPGVESVGLANTVPMGGGYRNFEYFVEGRPDEPGASKNFTFYYAVNADYFRAMGMTLKQGSIFSEQEKSDGPPVIVISESFARLAWPNQDAIGKQIRVGINKQGPCTVVGVVNDIRQRGPEVAEAPTIYFPYQQLALPTMRLIVRTKNDPTAALGIIRSKVWELDRELPVSNIRTMPDLLTNLFAGRRITTFLLLAFAAVALILATIGIYGVISYSVAQRQREIGIRMALGAQTNDVLRLVLKQGLVLIVAGVALGLGAALALARVLDSLLFGVSSHDSATLITVTLLLAAIALLASYIPARRATRVDPMIALRSE